MDADIALTSAAILAIAATTLYVYERRGHPTHHPLPEHGGYESVSAEAAQYSSTWSVADCQEVLDGVVTNSRPLDAQTLGTNECYQWQGDISIDHGPPPAPLIEAA